MTDWPVKTLGNLLEVSIGGIWGSESGEDEVDVFVYRSTELIKDGQLKEELTVRRSITARQLDSRKLEEGDLLLEKSGGGPKTPVGRVGLVKVLSGLSVCSNFMQLMRPRKKDVLPVYLHYFLNHFHVAGHTEDLQNNSTNIRNLKTTEYMEVEIPLPPLEEQKRIVALLDAATARVTELTACYEQARTHTNNLFTSALRDSLESNPDWPVKTLGDVCEVIAGQSPEGKFYNKEGKGVPFYQGKKDFAERVLGSPTTWTTEVTKLSRPGDILMSVRAPVGPVNLCPIEACIGRGLAAIRPSSKTDTDFIFYYLESIQSEIAGTEGAVFASINKTQIADLRCQVPPLDEQKRIVAQLDSMRAKTSEMVAAYDAKLTAAKNLRQSILESAFAGDL